MYKVYKNFKKNYPLYDVRPVSSMRDLVDSGAELYKDKPAFKYKERGEIVEVSYKDFKQDVDALGTALLDMGLDTQHIGIIGDNSYNWVRTYTTLLCSRGVAVPIDKELSEDEIKNIVNFSDCTVLFYGGSAVEKKIADIADQIPNVKYFISMTPLAKQDSTHLYIEDLVTMGKQLLDAGDTRFTSIEPNNEELKVLFFTSGTTGKSKGVMLNAKSLLFNILSGQQLMQITHTCLSVLPYHHSYESTTGLLVMMHAGMCICINESLRSILPNFKLYKPTEVLLVPLFVEKVYRGIWDKAEETGKAATLRKMIKLSNSMLKTGIDLRKKLFGSVTSMFGGNLRAIVCGGAPLKPQITDFFDSIGITLINGYGISECGPLISINRPSYHKYEAVGQLLPGMEIKIDNPNEDGEGEICVKGPNVMMGYYKNEEASAQALRDGWFHTGDVGKVDDESFIYLTGRIKNIIILKNGKNVYPEEIEEKLAIQSDLIQDVLVRAVKDSDDDERLLGAEIYPDYERAKAQGIEDVEDAIRKAVTAYNEKEASYKVIKKIIFRTEEFEKTTTKKIKRHYE